MRRKASWARSRSCGVGEAIAAKLIKMAEYAYTESSKAGFDMLGEVQRASRAQVIGVMDDTPRQENLEQPGRSAPNASNDGRQGNGQAGRGNDKAAGGVEQVQAEQTAAQAEVAPKPPEEIATKEVANATPDVANATPDVANAPSLDLLGQSPEEMKAEAEAKAEAAKKKAADEANAAARDKRAADKKEKVADKKSFFWSGKYHIDMNTRDTLVTDLNVLEDFNPIIPESYQGAEFLMLGNLMPKLQLSVINQMRVRPKLIVMDTMNFWMDIALEELKEVIKKVDVLLVNDGEARQLSGEVSLVKAARSIMMMGPKYLIIKKGEHGALLFHEENVFFAPALPLEEK